MDRINAFFDSDRVAGKAFNRISAVVHFADIDTSSGWRLVDSKPCSMPIEHPQLVIAERWMEAERSHGSAGRRDDGRLMI